MEKKIKDLRHSKQTEKTKINSSYSKNINNNIKRSPFVISQKPSKCFFLDKYIVKTAKKGNKNNKSDNNIDKSQKNKSYSNRINKMKAFLHKKILNINYKKYFF